MKLRVDLSMFLILILLSSTSNFSGDYFSIIPKANTAVVVEKSSTGNRGRDRDNDRVKEEYTLEVTDYSDIVWTFEEGREQKLYFTPRNISKHATTITGFDISNQNVATGGFGWDDELDVKTVWFSPKNVGITDVTIYVANDTGQKGKTTFKIKTIPYQRPIPADIEHQYIEVGERAHFRVESLLENGREIFAHIKDVSLSNAEVVEANIEKNQMVLTITGLKAGDSTITAHVYNMSKLGWNDIVDVSFPVTVTEAVYRN